MLKSFEYNLQVLFHVIILTSTIVIMIMGIMKLQNVESMRSMVGNVLMKILETVGKMVGERV